MTPADRELLQDVHAGQARLEERFAGFANFHADRARRSSERTAKLEAVQVKHAEELQELRDHRRKAKWWVGGAVAATTAIGGALLWAITSIPAQAWEAIAKVGK